MSIKLVDGEGNITEYPPAPKPKKPKKPAVTFIPKAGKLNVKSPANALLKHVQKQVGALNGKPVDFTAEELTGILIAEGLPFDVNLVRGHTGKRATLEQIEYRQKQIQRLMLRGVPVAVMALYLKLPLNTVYYDIGKIEQKIKMGVSSLDFPLFVGQALAFFDEAKHLALRTATGQYIKTSDKNAALAVAINAEVAKQKYLQMVGLYKNPTPVVPTDDGQSDSTDFETFMNFITMGHKGKTFDSDG